jgi:hypothetical protein
MFHVNVLGLERDKIGRKRLGLAHVPFSDIPGGKQFGLPLSVRRLLKTITHV